MLYKRQHLSECGHELRFTRQESCQAIALTSEKLQALHKRHINPELTVKKKKMVAHVEILENISALMIIECLRCCEQEEVQGMRLEKYLLTSNTMTSRTKSKS